MNKEKVSKFLSYVLRHRPDSIDLPLDEEGWADISVLIEQAGRNGMELSHAIISKVVATNDKQRFALSEDGRRVRANQGHSITVDLALQERQPPEILFHGTATRFLESIKREGLMPRSRHAVHLSDNLDTAIAVGKRHGSPVVFEILSGEMFAVGIKFQRAENGVWLTEHVPAQYLRVKQD